MSPNKYIPWKKTYLTRKVSKTAQESRQNEFESVEVEAIDGVHETSNTCEDDDTFEPYAEEPTADEEWLKRYHKKQEEKRRLEEDLTKR